MSRIRFVVIRFVVIRFVIIRFVLAPPGRFIHPSSQCHHLPDHYDVILLVIIIVLAAIIILLLVIVLFSSLPPTVIYKAELWIGISIGSGS